MTLWARVRAAARRVVEALGLASAPAPPPPPPAPPAPAPAWAPPPAPPLPTPRPLTAAERERLRLDRAADAAALWADRARSTPATARAVAQVDALRALPQLGPDQEEALVRGHPLLLPPLDYLQRWEGLSEEEALQRLEELEREGEDVTLPDRAAAAAAWDRLAAERPRPPAAQAPPAGAALQGTRTGLSASGDLPEAIRAVWEGWARSTLSQVGAPLTVVVTVEGDDVYRPPWQTWRQGAEAVLDWIGQVRGADPRGERGSAVVEGWTRPESPRRRRERAPRPKRVNASKRRA